MNKKPNLNDFKKNVFKEHDFVTEYDKLKPEFDFVNQLILARKKSKLSQAELAVILNTKQPAVARFENGGYSRSSLSTINDYANALGYGIKICLVPKIINNDQRRVK